MNVEFKNRTEGIASIDVKRQVDDHPLCSSLQLFATAVPTYNNTALIGSYENRSTSAYVTSIGTAVLDCCRVIPSGVVCFFPSYAYVRERVYVYIEIHSYDFILVMLLKDDMILNELFYSLLQFLGILNR